jgi:hypothetical protein
MVLGLVGVILWAQATWKSTIPGLLNLLNGLKAASNLAFGLTAKRLPTKPVRIRDERLQQSRRISQSHELRDEHQRHTGNASQYNVE